MYSVHTYVYRHFRQCTVGQGLTKNVPLKQTKLKSVIHYISLTIRYNKYLFTLCVAVYIYNLDWFPNSNWILARFFTSELKFEIILRHGNISKIRLNPIYGHS